MDVPCANCAAKVPVERDDPFLRCPFCGSTLYLDRARTFKAFHMPPAVPRSRVADLVHQHLELLELPRLPVRSCEEMLMPFWGVRGPQVQDTIPAFSPVPAGLAGFRLPPAGAVPEREMGPPGFERVACSESSSAAWEGREDISSFGLYGVPFFKVEYGEAGETYTAWVDAVEGGVRLDVTPPPLTDRVSKRFWKVMGLLFLGLTAEALLIPNGMAASAAVALTAALLYPALSGLFREGGT
jgi:hypothetical protein